MTVSAPDVHAHRRRRFTGRDPREAHRASTPLELLYDLIASLAAIGAGLHVAAFFLERKTEIGELATVLSVTIPIALYVAALYAVYSLVIREADPFHLALLVGTAAVLVTALVLAAVGIGTAVCLVVLMLAPVGTVVGFELLGHRHLAAAVARAES